MNQAAVAYLRVSTREQAQEGVSLATQDARIRAYAALAGLDLVAVIREEGVSGSKRLKARPGGQELQSLLASGQVQHVVCLRLDRAFRNAGDALVTTEAWNKQGVALHLVDLAGISLSTAGPMGRFMLCMLAGCAELERNLIAERTSQALQQLKAQGVKLGGPSYQDGDAIVRMQALRAQGFPLRRICEILTAEGYRTMKGGIWQAATVNQILKRAA